MPRVTSRICPRFTASCSLRAERARTPSDHRKASLEALRPEPEPAPKLSIDSFRNAWQLDPHGQAALRFLIKWYNHLDAKARDQAPETKTLLSIASRLPASREELGRIKGVRRGWAEEHGEHLTGALMRATAEASAEDFVPIEPLPYATVHEIRVEGWLALARAELSVELSVAPELAFPGRVCAAFVRFCSQENPRPNLCAPSPAGAPLCSPTRW